MKLSELDFENLALWPLWLRIGMAITIICLNMSIAYKVLLAPKITILKNLQFNIMSLHRELVLKQHQLANQSLLKLSPLSNYKLSSLKMGGILQDQQKMWAIIITPDEQIYPVTYGDKVGENFSVVEEITPAGIKLREEYQQAIKYIWLRY